MTNKNTDYNIWNVFAILSQVGFVIAIPAALFAYLGHKLDLKLDTSPWFLISGISIAIFTSSLGIYQLIKRVEKITYNK